MLSQTQVVVLLGAGASKPLGLPLMRDFWELLQSEKLMPDDQREVLTRLAEAYSIRGRHDKYPDLEIILDLLDTYQNYYEIMFNDHVFGWDQYKLHEYWVPLPPKKKYVDSHLQKDFWYRNGISGLNKHLLNNIRKEYWPTLELNKVTNLFSPLFDLLFDHFRQQFVPIFTTNYDPVIETYCESPNIHLENGFRPFGFRLRWQQHYFREYTPTFGKQNVVLFKLHGSLSWYRVNDQIFDHGLSLTEGPGPSVVIYPTQTKEYPNENPFKTAYNYLEECLSHARIAVVVGYSFRDASIRNVIRIAEDVNEKLYFLLICGDRITLTEEFRENGPRKYSTIPTRFAPGKEAAYLQQLRTELNKHL